MGIRSKLKLVAIAHAALYFAGCNAKGTISVVLQTSSSPTKLRAQELHGLYGWQTGGAYTGRVQNRWQQYYNRSFSPQHRYIIYRGIDNNDFAIWLETKLIQWSQDRGTGVKQDRIAVLNSTEYSANRTGCVYMVAINQDM